MRMCENKTERVSVLLFWHLCADPCGCWEIDLHPLGEQQVLLNYEASLQARCSSLEFTWRKKINNCLPQAHLGIPLYT